LAGFPATTAPAANVIGSCQLSPERRCPLRDLRHQLGVIRRDGTVTQIYIILEAHSYVASQGGGGNRTGMFLGSESANRPRVTPVVCGEKREQIPWR